MLSQPLKGVRVVDLTFYAAGPSAGRTLADLGADVIKVEGPVFDPSRLSIYEQGIPDNEGTERTDANKRGVWIDLKKPEGRNAIYRLIASSDVFLTNNRTSALERNGLDYKTLAKEFPRLIWAQITGWGELGPSANAPGFDTICYWANGGGMIDFPEKDTYPVIGPYGFGDNQVGVCLAGGVCAALLNREKTGKGDKVSASLYSEAVWANSIVLSESLFEEDSYPRSRKDAYPFRNSYQCGNGEWIAVAFYDPAPYWSKLCGLLGRPDLSDDPRFATAELVGANRSEIIPLLDSLFGSFMRSDELSDLLIRNGIPATEIRHVKDSTKDPQALENNFIYKFSHKYIKGKFIKGAATPFKLGTSDAPRHRNSPDLGEHTVEVFRGIGCTEEEIRNYLSAGAIGQDMPIDESLYRG